MALRHSLAHNSRTFLVAVRQQTKLLELVRSSSSSPPGPQSNLRSDGVQTNSIMSPHIAEANVSNSFNFMRHSTMMLTLGTSEEHIRTLDAKSFYGWSIIDDI